MMVNMEKMDPMRDWLILINKIKALSQIGQTYARDPFDLERYNQLSDIANIMYARLSGEPIKKIEEFFFPDKGYSTAKVDLRAGIFQDDRVLLVRERRDNKWALPGGWADVGETPTQGIVREVLEETGYKARVGRLVSVRDQSLNRYEPKYPVHVYKLFFLCEIISGNPVENKEISEIDFFPLTQLPVLSQGTTLEEDIFMLRDYFLNPDKLTSCD